MACGISLAAWGASAAQVPDPWAQVRRDARLPVAQQEDTAVQGRFQQWLMARIRAYRDSLQDTAVGKAGLINLGDFAALAPRHLAPPMGRGNYRILFNACATAGVVNNTIQFPQASADEYIDGGSSRFNTCWHEFQHVLALSREDEGRPLIVDYEQWRTFAKPPADGLREHIYVESLAESTVEWLDKLLHERSALTVSRAAGKAFEKYILEAAQRQKELEASGKHITYGLEHGIWAKAHDAWVSAWPDALKIAPLPDELRRDYDDLAGVRIPYIEDVIRHYHQGGLNGIHVPRWVMDAEPMKSVVIMGHLNPSEEIKGNVLRFAFDVRLMDGYRFRERSQSMNVGAATISLDGAGPDPSLEIVAAGKPAQTARAGKPVVVDLSTFKKDSSIRLTFVHPNVSKITGTVRFPISVVFKEEPVTVAGKTTYSFYYKAEAIYSVDVKGTGKPAAPVAASKPTPGKPSGTSQTPSPTAKKMQWVLTRKWIKPSERRHNMDVRATWDFQQQGVSFTASQKARLTDYADAVKASWSSPPDVLTPQVPVELQQRIDSATSSTYAMIAYWSDWFVTVTPLSPGTLTKDDNPHISAIATHTPSSKFATLKVNPAQTVRLIPPDGFAGDKLTLSNHASGKCANEYFEGDAFWEYEWKETSPQVAEDEMITVKLEAQEPATPESNPILDDKAPVPGEVVKIPPPVTRKPQTGDRKVKTKTPAPDTTRWYVHPTGDYRFKLADGWKVSAKHFFDDADAGYDTLWPADKGMAVICSRSANVEGTEADKALNDFAAKMRGKNPGAKTRRITLGPVQAVEIAEFDKESGNKIWHIAFYYKQRSYYVSVILPAAAESAALPAVPRSMLETLQMLR